MSFRKPFVERTLYLRLSHSPHKKLITLDVHLLNDFKPALSQHFTTCMIRCLTNDVNLHPHSPCLRHPVPHDNPLQHSALEDPTTSASSSAMFPSHIPSSKIGGESNTQFQDWEEAC
ncbi:hypothetical protein PAAG_03862 [Paracoccidioides lutzii Pb01]|uniref:Uncharacterized protein n=1 Tax=Paracoccidioides lutzii (strain ATCC MYA-826 / Pb01) TaxID=502779 RepID=C1GZB8_PARBA|nr:hypothetical protein PAAG_03862 [Paracoccidioides lutzii Pb01]EEH41941.2 hypothetical protein PAAG_03862 [Paracoccidioides lutzii Pb01]